MSQPVSIAILAAGLGTRMKSNKAKVLHHAGGMPLVEHVVRAAIEIAAEPSRVVTVVGHQAEQVKEAVMGYGCGVAVQAEQKGTGHALATCQGQLQGHDGSVIVLYGDTPLLLTSTLRRLIGLQEQTGAAAVVITTDLADPHGYGRILRDARGNISAIVEQKAATPDQAAIREINSGIYCFRAELLWKLLPGIRPNSASGEIYLTDMVEALNAAGHRVAPMKLDDPAELLGINTKVELAEADRIFRDRKVRQLMLDGVTIVRPETVTIDTDVTIGCDTIVDPFTQILGKTTIGANCRIGAGSIIRDSVLGDAVLVDAYTLIGTSHLEHDVHVGPFARLRMGNHVEQGGHIGNFVELKNTRLGAGSKSMHLAYLGDSTIGAKVNVGAGTITCNYDGRVKSKTIIGGGSFIGSNSTLVAPIEIGAGSYVAAGSVITTGVPEDTLALGRAHQVNKPGWPSRRKAKQDQRPTRS
jgi:bifunctional UDP-N-acetylglucosamine pyrophosphorylase/glucosamine-1-phosphate N-acetyltransferase